MKDFNGKNGNGYQPLKRPPTTDYLIDSSYEPDIIKFRTLLWFGFCCFCIGLLVGQKL
jgi:hypothetical protein